MTYEPLITCDQVTVVLVLPENDVVGCDEEVTANVGDGVTGATVTLAEGNQLGRDEGSVPTSLVARYTYVAELTTTYAPVSSQTI